MLYAAIILGIEWLFYLQIRLFKQKDGSENKISRF